MNIEMVESHPLDTYLDKPETLFCPGCGCGIVLNAVTSTIRDMYKSTEKIVAVSGIGCAGWISSPHMKVDRVHALHGRTIPFATGIKLANPELIVTIITGDGDLAGIGGNHLIHAARRNMPLAVIMVNNYGFAMTGGQHGPTTPHNAKTITSPYGNIETPFDTASLVAAAGAAYVARWTVAHPRQLQRAVRTTFEQSEKGFAFLEVISACPTRFGGRTLHKTAVEMLKHYKETSIHISKTKDLDPEEYAGKTVIGEFVNKERPSYADLILETIERAKK